MKKSNIFKPDIGDINNNEKVYYSYLNDKLDINNNPDEFIKNLDNNGSYIFSKNVIIKTKDNTYDTKIAGKIKNKIITIDSKVIPVEEIIDIYEYKKS